MALVNPNDRVAKLSPRRRELIRPALEDPRRFVLLSVRDMAATLGTDPATMVRIARNMGFESYKDFRHYLHELSIVRATSLDNMQSVPAGHTSVASAMQSALDQELKNFRTIYKAIEIERLQSVAERFWKARRILLLGGDAASCLVSYMKYHLDVLGLPVFSATAPGEAVHAVRNLGKKDLLFSISFRRGLRMTIEGIQQARKSGTYCVGVTDTYLSPVARFSNEFFLAPIDSSSFPVSYTATFCLFSVLLVAITEVRRPRILELMKTVSQEQRQGARFFEP